MDEIHLEVEQADQYLQHLPDIPLSIRFQQVLKHFPASGMRSRN
jgi:hypothetical protein